ncbi:multiheme c-type cytochrome [Bacteroidota bacterium]
MNRQIFKAVYLFWSLIIFSGTVFGQQMISDDSQTCIDCHISVTPGIVKSWEKSRHSSTNLKEAMAKEEIYRRVSAKQLPASVDAEIVIGCYECHSLNADKHKDNFEHFDYNINVVVSPEDCKTCHPVEVDEFINSKKGYAHDNLMKNPVYLALVETVTGSMEFKSDMLSPTHSSYNAKSETCLACHGTTVEVKGMKTIESDLGEIELPVLTNWPNQGVGRINPDGSRGACGSCHPRHSFSIEIARKPYTCGQCHLEPDLPAYNVYKESKHGNVFESKKEKWEWNTVPWIVGEDFETPTCAGCHNSLLIDSEENIVAERSHNFGSRLWVRIFGLIYSHPQPKEGKTYEIINSDNLPLPVSFDGKLASEFLITAEEQENRKELMGSVCKSCHSTSWIEAKFEKLDKTISEADAMAAAATNLMAKAWENSFADNSNPFDEYIEQLWIREWLFYANSLRYGSAMFGPDYAAFKNGWWNLNKNLKQMHEFIKLKSK